MVSVFFALNLFVVFCNTIYDYIKWVVNKNSNNNNNNDNNNNNNNERNKCGKLEEIKLPNDESGWGTRLHLPWAYIRFKKCK